MPLSAKECGNVTTELSEWIPKALYSDPTDEMADTTKGLLLKPVTGMVAGSRVIWIIFRVDKIKEVGCNLKQLPSFTVPENH